MNTTALKTIKDILRKLKNRQSRLKEKIHDLNHKLDRRFHYLERQIQELFLITKYWKQATNQLQQEVTTIQAVLALADAKNHSLQQYFESKVGQSVTILTPSGPISGIVVIVGTDSVELRGSNGEMIIIQYTRIEAVQ